MYITSRIIYGFNLGFEVIEVQADEENSYHIYKLDIGFVSIIFITKN